MELAQADARVRDATTDLARARDALSSLVRARREAGVTWETIAASLGRDRWAAYRIVYPKGKLGKGE